LRRRRRGGAQLGGDSAGSIPQLLLQGVRILTKTFAAQYSDAGEYRVPDLVEAAGLITLLADAERLPVVEIPRQVQVEPLTSRHRAMKAASAVKL
jgi:hypothetical protein